MIWSVIRSKNEDGVIANTQVIDRIQQSPVELVDLMKQVGPTPISRLARVLWMGQDREMRAVKAYAL